LILFDLKSLEAEILLGGKVELKSIPSSFQLKDVFLNALVFLTLQLQLIQQIPN
jgi:hypothetical protein